MKMFFANLHQRIKNIDVFSKKSFIALYSITIVCVMIIAVAQVGLRSTATRGFFTKMDTYEGAYFAAVAEVADEKIEAITLNVESDNIENAEIWINGKSYAALTLGDNEIKIAETSVIEIYSPEGNTDVKLTHITDGLIMYTDDTEITAEKGLKVFGRVGIK